MHSGHAVSLLSSSPQRLAFDFQKSRQATAEILSESAYASSSSSSSYVAQSRIPRGVITMDPVYVSVRSDQYFDVYYNTTCKGTAGEFPVPEAKTKPGIPDTFFLIKTDPHSLSFIEYLAIQAIRLHQGENARIRLYVQDSAFPGIATGCWWSAALELINEVILVTIPSKAGDVVTSAPAHRSDFVRFKVSQFRLLRNFRILGCKLHLWHKVSGKYYAGLTPENIEKGLSVATRALRPPYLAAKARRVCDL
ncbi:hypothetical protein Pelo_13436 [Pelomyxa schiedti]|nr:hypothetical protein Pelo_13436 [Pelomyxa schiedti]